MSEFLKLEDDFSNLNDVLLKYDDLLDCVEEKLIPTGKTLQEANKQMPLDYYLYAKNLQELKSIERFISTILQKKKGEVWAKHKSDQNLDLNTRDLEQYSTSSKTYIQNKTFLLIVQELVGQYEIVVKSFEHLGYKLKDITAAKIAEVNAWVI